MNVHGKSIIILLWLMFMLVLPFQAAATNVRGQVLGSNPYSQAPYPLQGVSVDIYTTGPAGWQKIYRFITGSDGMYYFNNLSPGNYTIQINERTNYPLAVSDQSNQDVPPILVKY